VILEGVCWKYPPIHHHNERVLSFIHAICVVIYWRRQSRFVQFCASNDTNQLFENVEILYIRGSTQPSTLRDPANTYNLIRMTNTEKINKWRYKCSRQQKQADSELNRWDSSSTDSCFALFYFADFQLY